MGSLDCGYVHSPHTHGRTDIIRDVTNRELTSRAIITDVGHMYRIFRRRDDRLLLRSNQRAHKTGEPRFFSQYARPFRLLALVRVACRGTGLGLGDLWSLRLLRHHVGTVGSKAGGTTKGEGFLVVA